MSGDLSLDLAPRHTTFAVADLHGRYDLLEAALSVIASYPGQSRDRTIVFLGDYIDRGPRSAEIIERLRAGPTDASTWICLKGNHEDMMIQALRDPSLLSWWIGNGGESTIESYRGRTVSAADHLMWLDQLPHMHVDARRVFVHAGVDPDVPLDAQSDKVLLWKRYANGAAEGHGDRHVVHGHHPHEDGPRRFAGRTALDTLAWRTGRLVVARFDDALAGGPVDLLEVKI